MFAVQATMAEVPDVADLVPPEPTASSTSEPTVASTFPRVLRRRLESFFAEAEISPKADPMMWGKIALGMAVLAGSWIALYTLHPPAWAFVALYVLGGLAQTFLLLNIAHDSNHNAISSRLKFFGRPILPFSYKELNSSIFLHPHYAADIV